MQSPRIERRNTTVVKSLDFQELLTPTIEKAEEEIAVEARWTKEEIIENCDQALK